MASEESESGVEHTIKRQTWVSEWEVFELEHDNDGLVATHSEPRGPVKNRKTLKCTCGRSFRKEETAVEHLRSVETGIEDGES